MLKGSKLSKVQTLAELDPVWRDWILQLRKRETGQIEVGDELLRFAKAALDRGEKEMALEFLEEARERRPDDAGVLWPLASLLETLKKRAQAAARYRDLIRRHIADTVADPEQVDEELRDLFAALSGG